MNYNRNNDGFQILGRVRRDEFIGRTAELERLVSHARRSNEGGSGEASEAHGLLGAAGRCFRVAAADI